MSKRLNAEARVTVGDGRAPNYFFVTVGNEIQTRKMGWTPTNEVDEEEYRPREGADYVSDTIGKYKTIEGAMKRAREIALSGKPGNGWSSVMIEDRLTGVLYQRGLLEVKAFREIERDDTSMLKLHKRASA